MKRASAPVLPYSFLILGMLALLAAIIALMVPTTSASGSKESPIKVTGAEYQVPAYGETSTPPTTVLSAGFEKPEVLAVEGETLAKTGADHVAPLGALAVTLLGVGVLLLRVARRRRSSAASS